MGRGFIQRSPTVRKNSDVRQAGEYTKIMGYGRKLDDFPVKPLSIKEKYVSLQLRNKNIRTNVSKNQIATSW